MLSLILFAVLIVGASLGLKFADIDLASVLPVKHRSAWTHGPIIPLALLWFTTLDIPWMLWFSLGFLPAYALHLSYDMFPKRWVGIAKISFHPIDWRLSGLSSFVYLWLSATVGLSVWLFIVNDFRQFGWGLSVSILFGLKYAKKENGTLPKPFNKLFAKTGNLGPLAMYSTCILVSIFILYTLNRMQQMGLFLQ